MRSYLLLLFPLFTVLLTGCFNLNLTATSPQPQLYLLSATLQPPPAEPSAADAPLVSLSIRSIRLPAYLNRLPIVSRCGKNEITFSEFHRWGEPVHKGIERVITENIEHAHSYYTIPPLHCLGCNKGGYEVYLSVYDFIADCQEKVILLSVNWEITTANRSEILAHEPYTIRVPLESPSMEESKDYQQLVQRMSEALGELCQRIVNKVQALQESEKLCG